MFRPILFAALGLAACGGRPSPLPVDLGAAGTLAVLAGGGLTTASTATVEGDSGSADRADALAALQAAISDASDRPPDITGLDHGILLRRTLVAGVYRWEAGVALHEELRLDGADSEVWILQIPGDLTLAPGVQVRLIGDPPRVDRILWQVGGDVHLGAGAHLEGAVLADGDITLEAGASLHGRALSQGAVQLGEGTEVGP